MSLSHRPPSLETRPLLHERSASYRSTDDVNSQVPDATQPANHPSKTDLYWMLAGLWSAIMLGAFDGTVVATLLTPIGSEFNASHKASYIGSSYLLSVCCFTPPYGRLADILGRKGSMLLALFLFGVGTICCGMAPSMNALIASRVIAGMGGGGVMTVASIAVTDVIPFNQRGLYQGIANIIYGLGAALGGPLGGWVNDNFGWRWAFYIQTPILIVSFVVVAVKVNIPLSDEIQRRSLLEKLRQIDYLGSITLAGAIGCFLLGIDFEMTGSMGWNHPLIIFLLLSSVICTFVFVMVEKYWAPYPVMPLGLILQRVPLAVSLSNLLLSMSVFSMLFSAPIFFTTVRLLPPTISGLYLFPHSIFIPIGSVFAGWYMRKSNKLYSLTLQAALMTLLASLLASLWSRNTPEYHMWLDIIPQSFGFACFITTTLIAMIAGVRKEDMPIGVGMTYLFRTTGQAIGVSLGGALLQAVLLQKLRAKICGPDSERIIYSIRHSAQIIPTLEPQIRQAATEAYADALRVVFICQAAICLLGFLACLPIQDNPFPGTQAAQEGEDRIRNASE